MTFFLAQAMGSTGVPGETSDLISGNWLASLQVNASLFHNALLPFGAIICIAGCYTRMASAGGEPKAIMGIILRLGFIVIAIANIGVFVGLVKLIVAGLLTATHFDPSGNGGLGPGNTLGLQQVFDNFAKSLNTKGLNWWGFINPIQSAQETAQQMSEGFLVIVVWVTSWLALGILVLAVQLQNILIQFDIAISPVMLSCLMLPVMVPVATRFCTALVGTISLPIAWSFANLLTNALVTQASQTTANNTNLAGNAPLAISNAVLGNLGWWIVLILWVFFAYGFGSWMWVKSITSNGSHGLTPVFAMMFGASTRIVNTTAGSVGSVASSSAPPISYRNYATRPGADDKT